MDAQAAGAERLGPRRAAVGRMLPLLLLALLVAVRVWNACMYDLRHQHDVRVHIGYLRDLAHGHLPQSYNAPWYYLAVCALALPAIAASRLLGAGDDVLLRSAVGLANTALFVAFLSGCLFLGRALGLGERDARWYAALAGAFPVVARTFNMVRPENLILTLTPWALVWLLRWAPHAAAPRAGVMCRSAFWMAAGSAALMMAQKAGGGIVVSVMPAFLAARVGGVPVARPLRDAARIAAAGAALAVGLIALQFAATGATPLVHDRVADPRFGPAPARFFFALDPAAVWRDPFRDAHRGSMLEILWIDLYGDYWRAGFDQVTRGRPEAARWVRARLGIAAAALFLGLWLASLALVAARCAASGRNPTASTILAGDPASNFRLTAAALWPLAASALYLVAAALRFHVGDDGDIAKWEYVVWVFVFLPIPLLQAAVGLPLRSGAAARAALGTLIAAGLLQSIV